MRGLNYETEHIEPYAFPAIMESETETEQNRSFSLWTYGINPSMGDSTVQNEQTPESISAPLNGNMLENLVVALTQALNDRSKVANVQDKSLNEGETIKQMDENKKKLKNSINNSMTPFVLLRSKIQFMGQ